MSGTARWPAPLRPGDRVALVAPSGVVDVDRLEAGTRQLKAWGYDPVELAHVRARHGHTAGTDDQRLADLQAAVDDPSYRAIWVVRGGFGATRIVHRVDWTGLAEHPRWLVGFSDVTALHHALWQHAGVVSCHGQFAGRAHLVARHADAADHLRALLSGTIAAGPLPQLAGTPGRTVAAGRATGPLLGGNLAVTCAGIGTAHQLDTRGAVLLLEDVNEQPYQVDRLLTQLRAVGMLDEVAGVVLGTFVGGEPAAGTPSSTVSEVVDEQLGALGVPVLADLPLGHRDRQLAVPHGATVTVDADAGGLVVSGAAVA